jgi:hypothetical protein
LYNVGKNEIIYQVSANPAGGFTTMNAKVVVEVLNKSFLEAEGFFSVAGPPHNTDQTEHASLIRLMQSFIS